MSTDDSFLLEMSRKIDGQELRLYQRDVQELREQYEKAKKCELEANQMLSIEKTRNKTQEREIERRRKQLEESTDFIKKLQADLEDARLTANGVKWQLKENEIKSMTETEIIHYRAQVSGLEAKLKRKQIELDLAHELIKSSQEAMERRSKISRQHSKKKKRPWKAMWLS
uniref:Uncharacterized protein n=1 Tax=Ditylenchus dipsaci TaxID=166011 RepID=A0A915DG23_9BILA